MNSLQKIAKVTNVQEQEFLTFMNNIIENNILIDYEKVNKLQNCTFLKIQDLPIQNKNTNSKNKIIKTDRTKTEQTISLLTKGIESQENTLEPEKSDNSVDSEQSTDQSDSQNMESMDSLENIKTTIIINDKFITDSFHQPEADITNNSQPSTPKTGILCEIYMK